MWETFGTNYFFHLADSYHGCHSPADWEGQRVTWSQAEDDSTHTAALWVQPSPPSAPCNFPKLPFNEENVDLISAFDVGQTVAAHSHPTDRRGANFHPKKKKKVTTVELSWLGQGEGIAKEKTASIKSNPSWDNGLCNQLQATNYLITWICHFFFSITFLFLPPNKVWAHSPLT